MKIKSLILILSIAVGMIAFPVSAYFELQGDPSWIERVRNVSDVNLTESNTWENAGGTGTYDYRMSASAFMTAYGIANHMHAAAWDCDNKDGTGCSASSLGDTGGIAGGWWWNGHTISTAPTKDWLVVKFYDENWVFKSNAWAMSKAYWSPIVAPVASFTCSPLSQYPDTDVVCTDTSTNTPTNWLWTLDYDALGIKAWQSSTSRNLSWQSAYSGMFSVNLYANNSAGGSWYNRSEYVEISQNASPITPETPIPAGHIRTAAQCVDSQTSGAIRSCQISLYDKEGSVWSNGSWYGTYYIDTLPAHHIDAYGVATGYTSTSRLDLPASGTIMYELLMVPGYVPPAADGYVWLYVIINDLHTGAPLPNAQVQVSSTGETTQTRTTGYNGQAIFQVTNNSVWHISASLAGYQGQSEVVTTSSAGPDVVRIELYRATVTTVPTGTVLPGELTPRPTQDPAGNPGTPGYTNAKGQEMMDWLAQNGMDLVQLCFMVTVLALLGVKLGK